MLKKGKAQAAMEFLMTYGWAILVVLIVIGALAYFGVLNPQRLLPERCIFQTGINCRDHLASLTAFGGNPGIQLRILNGLGRDIRITNGSIATGAQGNPVLSCNTTSDFSVTIKNGEEGDVNLTDCTFDGGSTPPGDVDQKLRWDIGLEWYYTDTSSDYAKIASGELFTTWQP